MVNSAFPVLLLSDSSLIGHRLIVPVFRLMFRLVFGPVFRLVFSGMRDTGCEMRDAFRLVFRPVLRPISGLIPRQPAQVKDKSVPFGGSPLLTKITEKGIPDLHQDILQTSIRQTKDQIGNGLRKKIIHVIGG
jgi:hypothetical protein